ENTKRAFADELNHPQETENYIYSRDRKPSIVATEKHIRQIEEAEWALLTQSGMAAIDTALSIFQKAAGNRWLFFSDIYGGTNTYIDKVLIQHRGIKTAHFSSKNGMYNLQKLKSLMDEFKPQLLYLETVSNPMLIVADAKQIINEAKKREIIVVIDNTFATPYLWKPLKYGVDIVVHSATKYLAGHGTLTAGVVCGNSKKLMQEAIEYRKLIGHMISPDDAYRLNEQLHTFKLRFNQQCKNAFKLAHLFDNSEKVEKVFYPGLKTHTTYEQAVDLFENRGFGAMISLQFAGENDTEKRKKCNLFMDEISKYFYLIPTLGDIETIFLPIETVWADKYPYPGALRLSVGIEEFEYLEKIFSNALRNI
ncbi:MAG: PLP-dependent aspartate aminotransferase family protein, partial [Bacteroidales bacterium]|nr:PLP-dependent aspartate aminotransferase family protein [Bacteroidales bacterium]